MVCGSYIGWWLWICCNVPIYSPTYHPPHTPPTLVPLDSSIILPSLPLDGTNETKAVSGMQEITAKLEGLGYPVYVEKVDVQQSKDG